MQVRYAGVGLGLFNYYGIDIILYTAFVFIQYFKLANYILDAKRTLASTPELLVVEIESSTIWCQFIIRIILGYNNSLFICFTSYTVHTYVLVE